MSVTQHAPARRRRVLTITAATLAAAGVMLIAYPFATDLWAAHLQRGLSNQLDTTAGDYRRGDIKVGDALTRLQIPKLGVDVVVVEGTTPAALHAGAGHYPRTPLPGDEGNVGIAGHRTTYGRPFNRLDELAPGDRVVLTTPVGRYVYEISQAPWLVEAYDWSPIRDYPATGAWLTLTTCHPEGSATHRIVARARLVSEEALS
ncbi:MAG TPA: class E sortase [Actinomycetota bacterium]|jgi:sortase A